MIGYHQEASSEKNNHQNPQFFMTEMEYFNNDKELTKDSQFAQNGYPSSLKSG